MIWLLRRLTGGAATVVGVVFVLHVALAAAPGDGLGDLPPGARAELAAQWGLDGPAWLRPLRSTASAITGDLGASTAVAPGVPVVEVVGAAVPRTFGWALLAGSFAVCASVAAGGRGRVARGVELVSAVPVFLAAHLTIAAINAATFEGMGRGWIERPAWFALPLEDHPLRTALAAGVLAVASGMLADGAREVAAARLDVERAAFFRAAVARGDPPTGVLVRHLVPRVAGLVRSRSGFLIGGLVILERVTLSGGLGSLLWSAVEARDAPVAVAAAAALVALGIGLALVCDAVVRVVDPRAAS